MCKAAIVIDSYITRALLSLSTSEVIAKYVRYFSDIHIHYYTNFDLTMELTYIYAESPSSSFSNETDGNKILNDFRATVRAGGFPGIPSSSDNICVYHLFTGRTPPGVGGLAWVYYY